MTAMSTFVEMLRYCRPQGSVAQIVFNERFLEPVFGDPDWHGNYIHIVYNSDDSMPNICFTAHHDTVHNKDGIQEVIVQKGEITSVGDDCLGADCTTGIYIILEMIKAQIPGVYVIHAAEEVGCKGSEALVKDNPWWLNHIHSVISFDRYGTKSIITHQMGRRTASEKFAESLVDILGGELEPDPTGSYTDSNEYADVVPECTNLSVGYYGQHTRNEKQDMMYLADLIDRLVAADWSKIVVDRDPNEIDYDDYYYWGGRSYTGRGYADYYNPNPYKTSSPDYGSTPPSNYRDLIEVITTYPDDVAWYLDSLGIDAVVLMDELGIQDAQIIGQIAGGRYGA